MASKFIYTPEQRDSDATNARGAAFRSVRDSYEWDDDDQKKAAHKAAAETARTVSALVEKGLTDHTPRKKWTDEQTTKAHRLICEKGLASYCESMESAGCDITADTVKGAMRAYEARLIQRRAEAEAAWQIKQGLDFSEVFGS